MKKKIISIFLNENEIISFQSESYLDFNDEITLFGEKYKIKLTSRHGNNFDIHLHGNSNDETINTNRDIREDDVNTFKKEMNKSLEAIFVISKHKGDEMLAYLLQCAINAGEHILSLSKNSFKTNKRDVDIVKFGEQVRGMRLDAVYVEKKILIREIEEVIKPTLRNRDSKIHYF